MKKTVFTFGLISGAVSSAMMLVTLPFHERIGFDNAEIIGYTTIVLSSLLMPSALLPPHGSRPGEALPARD